MLTLNISVEKGNNPKHPPIYPISASMIIFVIWYCLDLCVKGLPQARHSTLPISDGSRNPVTS